MVIDFDVGLRNLDLVMGAERRVVFDLINVVQGVAKLPQALIRDKRLENLWLLPASQTRDKDALTEDGVARVIAALQAFASKRVVRSTSAAFTFSSTEPTGALWECELDGQSVECLSSPVVFSGLANGTHTFSVAAIDGGVAFIARDGEIVGVLRLVELAPDAVIVDHVLVAAGRRREGIGSAVMQTAMNSRGGRLYLRCGEGEGPFFERLGFAAVEPAELPDAVVAHFDTHGPQSDSTTPMRAR